MKFIETKLKGAYVIELEPIRDDRGFFARSFCQKEFEKMSLNAKLAQGNTSFNHRKGTLRGMHFQLPPKAEVKLVRCIRGSIFDVIVDLRENSPTYCQWIGAELTADNRNMLYVPEGFAHGYQALEDDTEVTYQVSEFYSPEHERGMRWDDPAFGIAWPLANPILSPKDQAHPLMEVRPICIKL